MPIIQQCRNYSHHSRVRLKATQEKREARKQSARVTYGTGPDGCCGTIPTPTKTKHGTSVAVTVTFPPVIGNNDWIPVVELPVSSTNTATCVAEDAPGRCCCCGGGTALDSAAYSPFRSIETVFEAPVLDPSHTAKATCGPSVNAGSRWNRATRATRAAAGADGEEGFPLQVLLVPVTLPGVISPASRKC